MKRYRIVRILDGMSGLLNVAIFNGECDESVSGRAYRCGWYDLEMWIDFFLGRGHCQQAYLNDLSRASKLLRQHGRQND